MLSNNIFTNPYFGQECKKTYIRLMSRLGFLCFAFLCIALPTVRAEKIDNRNFAIDTCYPTPNEIRLAEERARYIGFGNWG